MTFVVLTADQLVGRDDGPLAQQKQDSHVCRGNRTFPGSVLILGIKSKKLRIRNGILHMWVCMMDQ